MSEIPKKNIYQRFIEVQKKVTSVLKNDVVAITQNSSYKAVSHDDVASLLHLPLAENGIVMLPTVKSYCFSTQEIEKQGYQGKPNYIQTIYRSDVEISVKWINADNPDDFFESMGAAFALDTSDKGFAKAYSLALKIVLLKVHLLESRDAEEQRDIETTKAVKTRDKVETKKEYPKVEPKDFVIKSLGSIKDTKIGDIPNDKLVEIGVWLSDAIKKDPQGKSAGYYKVVYGNIKKVIEQNASEVPSFDEPPIENYAQDPQSFPQYESENPFDDFEKKKN